MDEKLATAGTDVAKLTELIKGVYGDLEKTRGHLNKVNNESAERRHKLKQYEDAENERKKSEMDEVTRAQTELAEWKQKYEAEFSARSSLEAKLAFSAAGAHDPDSVLLHWQALPADAREKSNPSDFAKELQKSKPHLFGSQSENTGPHPEKDGAKPGESPKIPTHPKNQMDVKVLKAGWRAMGRR